MTDLSSATPTSSFASAENASPRIGDAAAIVPTSLPSPNVHMRTVLSAPAAATTWMFFDIAIA